MPSFDVTLKNVEEFGSIVSAARKCETPAWFALLLYGICPAGYFTSFSYQAVRVFTSCGGTSRLSRPDDFYSLSSAYVEVCSVIEGILAEIQAKRDK